jgi:small-conductance mechanosensitive channel
MEKWFLNPVFLRLCIILAGLLLIHIFLRILKRSLSQYIKDPETRYRARKFITFLGYLVGILFILAVFGDRIGNLHVAIGIAGAGVAFALQEVITSVVGWMTISFGQFYKPGDRIQLAGIKGDVIDIGVFRTTMMECGEWVKADFYNGRIVRVANSFVFKEPVFNYSADFPFIWDEIIVPVKFESDRALTREILARIVNEVVGEYVVYAKGAWPEIVKKYKIEDARIEPAIIMVATDNWMEFTVRYVVDYRERTTTKDRMFTRILEEFEETEGRVAIASTSTDIQLVKAPVFDVKVEKRSTR